jgi:hypothetical protein
MNTTAKSVLDDFFAAATEASTATKLLKDHYSQLVAHGNLSSYSMQSVFYACPRKYQIKKLQAATGTSERIQSVTFSFGHAVGAGVAEYDAAIGRGDSQLTALDKAVWAAFLAWDIDLLEIETKGTYADGTGKPTGKSFAGAIFALEKYCVFVDEETNLRDYETVKIEANTAVDFEDGHFYVGHIDELLKHKETGSFLVKENKTTGLRVVHPALYSNSDQALSYAVVIDMLGGNEFEVLYTIYSSSMQEWIQHRFVKSSVKKASWLQDQLLMHQQLDSYAELDFFPMRGASCFDFMRVCEYYGRCDMNQSGVFGLKFAELATITCKADLDKIEHVDYYTSLNGIVARQQAKLMTELN